MLKPLIKMFFSNLRSKIINFCDFELVCRVESSIGMVEWPRMVGSDLQGLHELLAVREKTANHELFRHTVLEHRFLEGA